MIQPNQHVLLAAYLYHAIDARYEELRARSSGGGRGGLSKAILEVLPVPLPPLAEQRRIADILDTADAAIQQTEALIAKLKLMRAGLLHDLLTRGLDENGQVRDRKNFVSSELGPIPGVWKVQHLRDVLDSAIDGPFGSNLKTSHYVDTPGVRVVRLQNIGAGSFDNTDKA